MDLRKLAGFYDEHAARAERELREYCLTRQVPLANSYLHAVTQRLLYNFYEVSHKVLLAQYKCVEGAVSFDEFCNSLRQAEIRAFFFSRYPVMLRWMDVLAMQWVRQAGELLVRLTADKDAIGARFFGGNAELEISTVQFGAGDAHCGGRSVARLEFANGRKLVYKPRSLQIDAHLVELVDWINLNSSADLRLPAVLDCGVYGWAEFVAAAECAGADDVDLYYRRLGAWVGLLYLLEGNDFHFENIIAAGSQPVLIDLESFFHPVAAMAPGESNIGLDTSVLRTGILPREVGWDPNASDISGMADVEGKPGVLDRLFMRVVDGTINFQRDKGSLEGAQNVPRLAGKKVELGARHSAALNAGFKQMYQFLVARKGELKQRLAAFAQDEVRVLFRPTVAYAHLLEESCHPSLMRAEAALEQHFRLLTLAQSTFPAAAQFLEFEMLDLQQRDVPLFTAKAGSRDLSCSERACIADFFETAGLERVLAKLERLSLQDMNEQAWIIEKTLTMTAEAPLRREALAEAGVLPDYAQPAQLQARLLQEAVRVGEFIGSHVNIDGDGASWLVIKSTTLDNSTVELFPAFYDLCTGMPGEILYLSHLARLTGTAGYGELAGKALNTLNRKLDDAKTSIGPLGLHLGWASVIYMFNSLAVLEGAPRAQRHFARIEHFFDTIDFPALITEDRAFSLIKGAAGFMLACADYHLTSGSPRALELAQLAAGHLLAHRSHDYSGYSWKMISSLPLSGMAHGSSGIAMAFGRMFRATRDPRFLVACHEVLAYERTLFVPEQQNWRDCRDIVTKNLAPGHIFCETTWAHGAPGIGLARVALLKDGICNAEILQDLEIAVRTTLARGLREQDSLISGNFGNADLLISCQQYVDRDLAQQCGQALRRLQEEIDVRGWKLGEKQLRPLGLMIGVTGIGYQYLRWAYPDQVPSILCGVPAPWPGVDPGSREFERQSA